MTVDRLMVEVKVLFCVLFSCCVNVCVRIRYEVVKIHIGN